MFGKFLKPRWQHKDPEVREKAVTLLSLDQPEHLQALTLLARDDAAQAVRCAAIARLTDLQLLGQLQQQDQNTAVRTAAEEQIQKLLAGTAEHSSSMENRLRLIGLTDNNAVLAYVARHSQDSACRLAAIERLDDQNALHDLAVAGTDEPTRVAATEKLTDIDVLRRLVRDGRDKRVLRMARDQLKRLNDAQQAQRDATERAATLVKELASHSTRVVDNLYAPRLAQLRDAWREVSDTVDPAFAEQAETAITACQQRLDQLHAQQAEAAAHEEALAELQASLSTLTALQDDLRADSWNQLNALRSLVATQYNRWQTACETQPATPELQQRADTLFMHWQQCFDLVDAARQDNADIPALKQQWPAGFTAPDILQQPPETPAPPPAAENPEAQALRKALTKVLAALQRELNQRNLKHANRLWRKAEALLEDDNAPDWRGRLEKLRAQRDELRDWHAFAAEPKKEKLCAQMEALITQDMDVEEKASAIHALHDAWRELMSADQESDQALWDRFREASDNAYLPCRDHFREQDALKAENTGKRRQLVAQLTDFINAQDWEQVNWQHVFDIRRTAPKEWSSYQPVDFTRARELGRQFSTLLKQLDEKLDAASADNSAMLETLIDEGAALQEGELPRNSVDQWKELQQRWKNVGWVQPNRYRTLNKRFRKLGDALFARLDDLRKEQKQEAHNQKQALQQAMNALQALLDVSNEALDISAVQTHADALSALPCPARDKPLDQQRQALLKRVRGLRKWQTLWKKWQALHDLVASAPLAEETTEQRQLAVAVEAAANHDSPEDAREERMQWQLAQLQNAMRGANEEAPEAVTRLLSEHDTQMKTGLSDAVKARLLAVIAQLEPKR